MDPKNLVMVPADAVRVWHGYIADGMSLMTFLARLGTVFVPATVKMQILNGLCAYLPSIPAGLPDKPASVPDETAVLFWESSAAYYDAFATLATRTYTLTHGGVYDSRSRADFPTLFDGHLALNAPCNLFDKPADWMHGLVQHVVGVPASAVTPSTVAAALAKIQSDVPLDGAIAILGEDYFLYWELLQRPTGSALPPSGLPLLRPLLGWQYAFSPAPTFLPLSMWDTWSGMSVSMGSSFNMQFERRQCTLEAE
jgi:hypothetical protein